MTYNFFQDGYDDGAFISGSFNVQDLNGDGIFAGTNVTGPAETLSYGASFSGSSTIPAFEAVSGLGIFDFLYNPATNDLVLSTESPFPSVFRDIRITHGFGSITYGTTFFSPFLTDTSTAPVVVTLRSVGGVPVLNPIPVSSASVPDSGAPFTLLALSFSGLIALRFVAAHNQCTRADR
jgi:hypothetical protein